MLSADCRSSANRYTADQRPVIDSPTEERQVVWEILAQFWVDTWYDAGQLDQFAERLAGCGFSVRELDRIAYQEVCGAFAIFTIAGFASMGMAFPDWFFPEQKARQKIGRWLSRPRFLSVLNPLWVAGYIAARMFLRRSWSDLRARVVKRLELSAV
jgi:hypothetical protein